MISYDQYENRIKKLAKFKNFMNRFKFLFIAIFALIIAALATLLALKGSLSGEIKIASSIYGDGYAEPEGVSAFWSSVSYEYAREGSDDWSEERPYKAGKYSVRAVSNKTVGKGYGKETEFEIAPREVTFGILSDSVEYGGVPNHISLELLDGDTLDKNALLFVYDNYVANKTGVDLDESSVKITNGTDDRSSCYTVKHEKKELDITKRKIDVSLKRYNFTYSGSAVSYSATASEQTEGRLANGDIIRFGSVQLSKDGTEITNAVYAGSYEAVAQEFHIYKVIDGKEIEVTTQYQYDVSAISVSFEIEKKSVTVETPEAEKYYDGTPLTQSVGFTASGLVEGDTFIVSKSTSLTNADTVRNEFLTYAVKNGENDLSANYDIAFIKYGMLTVKPRPITVSSPDSPDNEDWVYDGTEKSLAKVSCEDDLFKGDDGFKAVANTTPRTTIKTAGAAENAVYYEIYNKSGEIENKKNFEITEAWGTLKVTPRNITITIQNVSKVYDGMPLYATLDKVEADNLAESDKLSDDNTIRESITDVAENVPNNSRYKIICGIEDRTKSYNIVYGDPKGTLTVTPRHITVLSESQEFVYDGEPHSNGGYIIYENGEISALYAGNTITLIGSVPAFTTVSETKDVTENNKCEYTVSDNYVIDKTEYGTITIIPREITVYTNSETFVYDGDMHWNNGYTTAYGNEKGLCGTDELLPVMWAYVINVSENAPNNNDCTYKVPNGNYEIGGVVCGTLTVAPRPIRVVTDDATKVYDGDPLSDHTYVRTYYIDGNGVEQAGLLQEGETLIPKDSFSITNVWESGYNKCTFTVPADENGVSNYFLADDGYDYGTLTITARPIMVVISSKTKEYDGKPLLNYEYDRTYYIDKEGNEQEGLLQEGETLTPIKSNSITNVYESGVDRVCEFSVPNENYAILGYVNGTLTITPKSVTVKLNDVDAVYGEDYREYKYKYPTGNNNFSNVEDCGFIGNDTVEVEIRFDLTDYDFSAEDPELVAKGILPVTWEGKNKWVLVREYGEIGYFVGGYTGAVRLSSAKFDGAFESNYTIDYAASTLYILRRVLIVEMNDRATFYGEDLHPTEKKYVYYAGEDSVKEVLQYKIENQGLLPDDSLLVTKVRYIDESGSEEYASPKNAGTYNIKPYEILIRTSDGKEETTTDEDEDESKGNYLVAFYDPGTLTVKRRPVEFSLTQIESTCYDGKARKYATDKEEIELALDSLSAEDKLLIENPEGLVYGEKLRVKVIFNDIDIDDYLPKFAGKYSYAFDEKKSVIINADGSESNLENYSITCKNKGAFEILRRAITIQLRDLELDYGEAIQYPSSNFYDVTPESGITECGDYIARILIDFGYENDRKVNKGTYPIKIVHFMIWNSDMPDMDGYHDVSDDLVSSNDPVTNSYEITYVGATLTVSPKQVRVTAWKGSGVYGTSDPGGWLLKYENTDLGYDETLDIKYTYFQDGVEVDMPKDAGLYDIQLTPVLSIGEEGLKNYTFIFMNGDKTPYEELIGGFFEGMLEIVRLQITVSVSQKDSIKYGDSLDNALEINVKSVWNNRSPWFTALPYGEKITVPYSFQKGGADVTPKYADTYDIVIGEQLLINNGAEGLKNYDVIRSDEAGSGKLTITPRPITLELKPLKVIYGDAVEYEKNFIFCETKAGSTFGYEDIYSITPEFVLTGTNESRPDVGTYTIKEKSISVFTKIYDESGEFTFETQDGDYAVADSYEISVIQSELTVVKRKVTLTLDRLGNVPYDGQAHNYDVNNFTADGILEDEKLVIAVKYKFSKGADADKVGTNAIAKAGYYAYTFDLDGSSVENGGAKGIGNYAFTEESFTWYNCQVRKLGIDIKISDMDEITYGEAVSYAGGAKEYEGLVAGETLEIFVSFRNKETRTIYENENGLVLPAGEYDIIPSRTQVYSSNVPNYADIDNYDIYYDYGALKVKKREITITLNNIEADYGEAITYPNMVGNYKSIEGHLGDEQITVQVNISVSAGASVNTYEKAVTFDSAVIRLGGKVVTSNYSVKCASGNVIVNPRKIIVTTPSKSFVYDGEAHVADNYKIVYAKDSTKGLAEGDTSEIIGKIPSVTDYSPTKTKNEYAIAVISGGVDVSNKNYIIEYDDENPDDNEYYGYIWITKRVLYVETESVTKVYDGDELTSPDTVDSIKNYTQIEGKVEAGLVKEHQFVLQPVTFTEADSRPNNVVVDIVDKSGEVTKKQNYAIIESKLGTLTIEKRIIYVKAPSDKKVYDGTELYSPKGEKYVLYFYPENNLNNTPISVEWINASDSTDGILVGDQKFKVKTPSIKNVGELDNNPFSGVMEGTEDKSGNYSFVFENAKLGFEKGTLKVTRRFVSYWIYDYEMDYCNDAPSVDDLTIVIQKKEGDAGVLPEEEGSFDYKVMYQYEDSTQKVARFNVGTYIMGLAEGDFSKQNYIFQCEQYGNLTIDQVELLLIPANKRESYGECQEIKMVLKDDGTKDDLERIGLVLGDRIQNAGFNRSSLQASENKVSASVKITAGKVVIVDENGNNITNNYKITSQAGSMTFIQRTLYVQQIVPEDGYIQKNSLGGGSIAYTGKAYSIANNGNLFYVLDESDSSKEWTGINASVNLASYKGLYGSDKAIFKSASVSKNVITYTQWLKIDVLNGSGKTVTKLYNVVYVNLKGTESSIKVLPERVSVTVKSELTTDVLNGSQYSDGVTVLESIYIESFSDSAFFEESYQVDAAVYKRNGEAVAVYVFIYVPKYDAEGNLKSRSDKSAIFAIDVVFESDITVEAKLMTIVYYPAASNQGEESEA